MFRFQIVIPLNSAQRQAFADFFFDVAKGNFVTLATLLTGVMNMQQVVMIILLTVMNVVAFLYFGYTLLMEQEK